MPEGSYKIESVRPSVLPSVFLPRVFLGIASIDFSEIWHGARNSHEIVHDRAGISDKIFFTPKLGKRVQNVPKQGFFNLLENLVINFNWIWYIMEIYIICCVSSQVPYFWKNFVPEICAKMFSANQIAGFFIQPYLQTNQWNSLIFCMLIQIRIN